MSSTSHTCFLGFGYLTRVPDVSSGCPHIETLAKFFSGKPIEATEGVEQTRHGSIHVFFGDTKVLDIKFCPPKGGVKESRCGQKVFEFLKEMSEERQAESALIILQVKVAGVWRLVDLELAQFCEGHSKLEVVGDSYMEPERKWIHEERKDNTDVETIMCDYNDAIITDENVVMELHIVPLDREGLPTILLTEHGHVNPYELMGEVKCLLEAAKKTPLLGTQVPRNLKCEARILGVRGVATPSSDVEAHEWAPRDHYDAYEAMPLDFTGTTYYMCRDGSLSKAPNKDNVECDLVVSKLQSIEQVKELMEKLRIALSELKQAYYRLEFDLRYSEYSGSILAADQKHMDGCKSARDGENERVQKELESVVCAFEKWAKEEQTGLEKAFSLYTRTVEIDSNMHLIEPLLNVKFVSPETSKVMEEVQRQLKTLSSPTVPVREAAPSSVAQEQEERELQKKKAERNRQYRAERGHRY